MRRREDRRRVLQLAGGAVAALALAGWYFRRAGQDEEQFAASLPPRPDGRPRLPPGQRLVKALQPMGGEEGDPDPAAFHLRVHGAVRRRLDLNYADLLALPQTDQICDVHCVTSWSLLDGRWQGVQLAHLAERAGVRGSAAHVIFEAVGGYTANVPLEEATLPNVLVAHRFSGDPLGVPHGAPVRALVPDLYFWKSAKWLTGIRFSEYDEPGYWEVRGYHNHGDPWLEERYG
jgi:DMSO/TMAO reductase YedYZ molybdopterin-dependent catalytic subunit